jgi:hypothetical protein
MPKQVISPITQQPKAPRPPVQRAVRHCRIYDDYGNSKERNDQVTQLPPK